MSTIKSFDEALDFHPGSSQLPLIWRMGRTVRTYLQALRDGVAAARAYNEMTNRGVPHDAAVQHVLRNHFRA